MEKRVTLEMRGKKPEEIKELVLDCCRSTSIVGITDKFCNLEILSVINAGLTNLKGFPKLPKLRKLDLSDNRISGGLENVVENCPELVYLHLCGNKIDKIEALEPLKGLSNLIFVDLNTCKVTSTENYRENVFKLLPNLKYLDGFDQNEEEFEESFGEINEDGDEESDEDEEDGNEVGLSYLQKSQIDEESEGDDYAPDEEEEPDVGVDEDDDEIDSEEEEEESPIRGEKRKHENDD